MDEKALEFWNKHSVNFLRMALLADKRERITHADGYGQCSRECGDALEIFLTARNNHVHLASFYTEGCIYTVACANAIVRMVEGKTARDAWTISAQHIVDFLQTLPEGERHCAELAVRTLRAALLDLQETERQPWTKFYRKQ